MAEMQITNKTTIQELQRFTTQVGDDKIRGRDNGDGTYTLYTSNKGSGTGFKNFFGMLDGRKQAAKDAIDMVMRRVDTNVSHYEKMRTGFTQDYAGLGGFSGKEDIRGNAFASVVNVGEQLYRDSGAHLPAGMHIDGRGNMTGEVTLTGFQRPGGRMDPDSALKDGGDGLIAKSNEKHVSTTGGRHSFGMAQITYDDFSRLNISLNGHNTNCSGLGGSQDPRHQAKMEQSFTELRNLAGSNQAATVLSSVLNQNMLSILHKGLQTPEGDLITLTQKKNVGNDNYVHKDSEGVDHGVGPLQQYVKANINVTTEPNGDFRVTVDWPMHFNATRSLNTQKNDGDEMRLTPGDDNRVQLSRTQGSFVVSKQDAERGILTVNVDTPFSVSFDGNLH